MKLIKENLNIASSVRTFELSDNEVPLAIEEIAALKQAFHVAHMEYYPTITVYEFMLKHKNLNRLYSIEFRCRSNDVPVIMFPIFAKDIDELLKFYIEIVNSKITI